MQLVLVQCWWLFDLQMFLQQYEPEIGSAKFRLVDSANWDLAWSALSSSDGIKFEHVDLELQGQDWRAWFHQLAQAQSIIGWYLHELLEEKLNESMLQMLVKNGAVVLLGCPAAG